MQNRPILVIDDDPRACELVDTILADADFQVLSAFDGQSGLELARTTQPAVIILDMMLPGMGGVNTLEVLKRDPVLRRIPVIGITASADLTLTEKAFRAGAQFFLPKPFRAASLLRVVELAVDSARRDTPMLRRRRHPRHPAEVPVWCFVRGAAGTTRGVVGHTSNVSLGGLLLLLPETLEPGTSVRLGLGLPEGSITAKGTVMWQDIEPIGGGKFHHGVQFAGFAEEGGLSKYRHYLSQITANPPS